MTADKELGQRIKDIRLSLGKTQEEFGKLFEPSAPKSAVSRWEHGGSPNKKRLKEIADLGHVPVSKLVGTDKMIQSLVKSIDNIFKEEDKKSLIRYSEILQTCLKSFNDDDKKHLEELQNKVKNVEELRSFEYLVSELLGIFLYAKSGSNKKVEECYANIQTAIDNCAGSLPEFQIPQLPPMNDNSSHSGD